ncbi:MAG: 30S ribosomal protein S20 [Polyangiaceae bacterium]|nr:30S ribosomal protein S20 [Polyangiaceae bacterium]
MANHPSAAKRNRQRLVRAERNKSIRSAVRTAVKKARAAAVRGDESAKALMIAAEGALARAASKGVLSRKSASRTTSRINIAANKVKSG